MTTDLKSKTVVELALYFGSLHDQACNAIVAFDELARRLEEAQQQLELYAAEMSAARAAGFYSAQELWSAYQTAQQKIVAQEAKDNYVGRWLSAALDDPSVCDEMKADIRLWMASDAVALAANNAEVAAEAKAEVLGHAIGRLSSDSYFVGAEEAIRIVEELAAEYRAKAKGDK